MHSLLPLLLRLLLLWLLLNVPLTLDAAAVDVAAAGALDLFDDQRQGWRDDGDEAAEGHVLFRLHI